MNRPNSVLTVARLPPTRARRPGEQPASGPRAPGAPGAGPAAHAQARAVNRAPLPVTHVERDHVVGGAPVAQRPRAAGVVADRAADGGARVRGRVGAEPQAVRRGGRGDRSRARRRARRPRSAAPGRRDSTRFRCREGSSTSAGATARCPRSRCPRRGRHERHAELPADRQRGDDLVGVPAGTPRPRGRPGSWTRPRSTPPAAWSPCRSRRARPLRRAAASSAGATAWSPRQTSPSRAITSPGRATPGPWRRGVSRGGRRRLVVAHEDLDVAGLRVQLA